MLPSRKRKIVYSEYDENAPVPSPLPIPNCECGIPAEVKQSRHPKTAARAYYTCSREWSVTMCFGCPITCNPCDFFQWITDLRSLTLEFVYFLIMRMKLSHTMSSSDGCLLHQILLRWRRKRRPRLQASVLQIGHCATVESLASFKDLTLNYLLSSHCSSIAN